MKLASCSVWILVVLAACADVGVRPGVAISHTVEELEAAINDVTYCLRLGEPEKAMAIADSLLSDSRALSDDAQIQVLVEKLAALAEDARFLKALEELPIPPSGMKMEIRVTPCPEVPFESRPQV